jgi:hypothetical protein
MVNLIEMRSNWLGGGAVAYGTAGEHTAIERRCDRDVMDGEIVGVVDALARNGLGLPWCHIPGPKSATARSADRQLVETEFRTMVITSESVDIISPVWLRAVALAVAALVHVAVLLVVAWPTEPDLKLPLPLQIDIVAQGKPVRSLATVDNEAVKEVRASETPVSDTKPAEEPALDAARPADSAVDATRDVAEAKPVGRTRVVAPDRSDEMTPRPTDTADAHPEPTVEVNQEQSLPEVAVADAVAPIKSRAVAATQPASPQASPADTHEPRVHAEEVPPPKEQAQDLARAADSPRDPPRDVAEARPVGQTRLVPPDSAETKPRPPDTHLEPVVAVNQERSLLEVAVAAAAAPVASRAVATAQPASPQASPADTHEPRVHAEEVTPPREQTLSVARPAGSAQDPPRVVAEAKPVEQTRVAPPDRSAEMKPRPPDTADTHPSAIPMVKDNQEQSPEVAVADAVALVVSRAVAAAEPARPQESPADTHEPRVHAKEVTAPQVQGVGFISAELSGTTRVCSTGFASATTRGGSWALSAATSAAGHGPTQAAGYRRAQGTGHRHTQATGHRHAAHSTGPRLAQPGPGPDQAIASPVAGGRGCPTDIQ